MAIIAGVVVCIVKKNKRSRGAIIAPFNTNTTGVTIGNNSDFFISSFFKLKFLTNTVKSEIQDIHSNLILLHVNCLLIFSIIG